MIKKIFGEKIGIYNLPNAESYNDDLIKFAYYVNNLKSFDNKNIDNINHSFIHRSHLIPGYPLKFLDDVIWAVNQYKKELGSEFAEKELGPGFSQDEFPYLVPYVSAAWTNVISQGKFIQSHNHEEYNAKYGVVYYPKFLSNQGNLCVEDTIVSGQTGRCIIVPGYLTHYTEINESTEDRISASCDIKFLGINSDLPPVKLVEELTSSFQRELKENIKL